MGAAVVKQVPWHRGDPPPPYYCAVVDEVRGGRDTGEPLRVSAKNTIAPAANGMSQAAYRRYKRRVGMR